LGLLKQPVRADSFRASTESRADKMARVARLPIRLEASSDFSIKVDQLKHFSNFGRKTPPPSPSAFLLRNQKVDSPATCLNTWYFSIVDVVEILTDSPRPRKYWNALKTKLKQEGSE